MIGKRFYPAGTNNSALNGSMEYFAIYNKKLTEQEIAINEQASNKSDLITDEIK